MSTKTSELIEQFVNEGRDPAEVAHNLIRNSKGLVSELQGHVKKVEKSLKSANSQLDGLKKVGSHYISAPKVLAGDPLRAIKPLQTLLNNVVKQIEELQK